MGRKAQERRYQSKLAKLRRRHALGDPSALDDMIALEMQDAKRAAAMHVIFKELDRLLSMEPRTKTASEIVADAAFHAELSR